MIYERFTKKLNLTAKLLEEEGMAMECEVFLPEIFAQMQKIQMEITQDGYTTQVETEFCQLLAHSQRHSTIPKEKNYLLRFLEVFQSLNESEDNQAHLQEKIQARTVEIDAQLQPTLLVFDKFKEDCFKSQEFSDIETCYYYLYFLELAEKVTKLSFERFFVEVMKGEAFDQLSQAEVALPLEKYIYITHLLELDTIPPASDFADFIHRSKYAFTDTPEANAIYQNYGFKDIHDALSIFHEDNYTLEFNPDDNSYFISWEETPSVLKDCQENYIPPIRGLFSKPKTCYAGFLTCFQKLFLHFNLHDLNPLDLFHFHDPESSMNYDLAVTWGHLNFFVEAFELDFAVDKYEKEYDFEHLNLMLLTLSNILNFSEVLDQHILESQSYKNRIQFLSEAVPFVKSHLENGNWKGLEEFDDYDDFSIALSDLLKKVPSLLPNPSNTSMWQSDNYAMPASEKVLMNNPLLPVDAYSSINSFSYISFIMDGIKNDIRHIMEENLWNELFYDNLFTNSISSLYHQNSIFYPDKNTDWSMNKAIEETVTKYGLDEEEFCTNELVRDSLEKCVETVLSML